MKKLTRKIVAAFLAVIMMLGCFSMLPGISFKQVSAATSGECGDNLTWTFEDGTLTISGTGNMWDLVWDEDECSYIYPDGWYNELEDDITKIVISDGVTSIGDAAFEDYAMVTSIELPNSIKRIGDFALSAMYGGWEELPLTINIPDGVTEIGIGAFQYSNLNGNIVIPDSVKTIGNGAFYSCGANTISIGAGVSSIGLGAFGEYLGDSDYDTGSLTAINVDSDNNYYSSIDGVLFDKSAKTLIHYPNGKTATSYEVPDGVTKIATVAFDECLKLATITLPSTLATVEEEAFDTCIYLKTVNYKGTKSDWSKISIAKTVKVDMGDGEYEIMDSNTPLLKANIVYNYGVTEDDSDDEQIATLKITARSLNVRKGAGTNYGIITSVKKDNVYPYTATKKVGKVTWYKITVNSTVSGWVSGSYIKIVSTGSSSGSSDSSENTIKVTGSTVNVRKGAGTKYARVALVKKNSIYPYTDTKKVGNVTWYKIKVSDTVTGWISGAYAKPTVTKIKVTGYTVNVRKGAGTKYAKVALVKQNSVYTYTDTKKVGNVTWYKIKVSDTVTGWISGVYAKTV